MTRTIYPRQYEATFEPFDPEAATFSPSRLGMTQEEIIQRINHYRQTGERTLPADSRRDNVPSVNLQ